jgi:Holliday junction resolvase
MGRTYERAVKQFLTTMGFFVVRSAGSHGLVDIIAVNLDKVLFIQCKLKAAPGNEELNDLYDLSRKYGAIPTIAIGPRPSNMFRITAKNTRYRRRSAILEKYCPWLADDNAT